MSTTAIEWIAPTLLANTTYSLNVYRSQSGENGQYSLIDSISAGPSNSTTTYTDNNGDVSYWYYVTYIPSGGSEGQPVLAMIQPTIRERRLRDRVYSYLPEVIAVRIDANKTQVRSALQNALNMVNAYAPVTAYNITTMPPYHETAVEFGAQMLLYMEILLQISIRDFSYGVSGISLNIDRGAKMNQALIVLREYWNEYLKSVKFYDYPDAIGLGSSAMAVPQGRVLGMLYNLSM